MPNKNCLHIYRNRYYTYVEIRCDMQQYYDTIDFILKVLGYIAKGRNIFAEYCGHNQDIESSDHVIEQITDSQTVLKKKLWLRETWLSVTNKSFDEEPYTILYIFDSDFLWSDFLEYSARHSRSKKKNSKLQLLASFGECEFPCLYIKHGNQAETEVISYFKNKGFVLKYHFCFVAI